jgi:hypothetical protein
MAGVLNLFCPGLGHLVTGRPFSGLAWFIAVPIGYLCLVVPGIILHICCIVQGVHISRVDDLDAIERRLERTQRQRR